MTLGGLSLAIGILVGDATVEIENIHRNLGCGKPLTRAILDGAQQIAAPTFVSTLAICIVFVSVIVLRRPAKYLFTPLAVSVVFAMLASYLLSRTLVPVLVKAWLRGEVGGEHDGHVGRPGLFARVHGRFNRGFEVFRSRYGAALSWALAHRVQILVAFGLLAPSAFALVPFVGRDFFPTVDAGQFRLHVRAPAGTRLEETEVSRHEADERRTTYDSARAATDAAQASVRAAQANVALTQANVSVALATVAAQEANVQRLSAI
jgi:multidrug efflux pump subunit AcrB